MNVGAPRIVNEGSDIEKSNGEPTPFCLTEFVDFFEYEEIG